MINIFSVYLARSLGTDKFPCTVWAFNLVELTLLFVFTTQNSFPESFKIKTIVSIYVIRVTLRVTVIKTAQGSFINNVASTSILSRSIRN